MVDSLTDILKDDGYTPVTLYIIENRVVAGVYVKSAGDSTQEVDVKVGVEYVDHRHTELLLAAFAKDLKAAISWLIRDHGVPPMVHHVELGKCDCGCH